MTKIAAYRFTFQTTRCGSYHHKRVESAMIDEYPQRYNSFHYVPLDKEHATLPFTNRRENRESFIVP